MATARRRGEAGQITAMLVIFSICLLIAVAAVTDISASYLRRQAATSLADGAALAATDAAAAGGVYTGEDIEFVTIDEASAAAAVDEYLRNVGAYDDYPGLRVDVAVVGHTVEVTMTMPDDLPVTMPGVDATTTIHSRAAAQLPIY
jgi:hypothetical protein